MNEKVTQFYIRGHFYILILKEFLIGNERELERSHPVVLYQYSSILVSL